MQRLRSINVVSTTLLVGVLLMLQMFLSQFLVENDELAGLTFAAEDRPGGSTKTSMPPHVRQFFADYCVKCHSEKKQKGDRRLDRLNADTTNVDNFQLLKDIRDVLNRGEMPPQSRGVKQPDPKQSKRVIDWLTNLLLNSEAASASGNTVMRRLNRFEYLNTIRDLLKVDTNTFDPTGEFPFDTIEDGFDNNGEALILSDYQLHRYLESAEAFLDKAVYFNSTQPQSQVWRFAAKDLNGKRQITRGKVSWLLNVDDKYTDICHGKAVERHPTYAKSFSRDGGVPVDGYYTIRVNAEAKWRLDHRYDARLYVKEIDLTQPLKLGVWVAPEPRLLLKSASAGRILAGMYDLEDDQPRDFVAKLWLTKGSTPFLSWANGISSKGVIQKVSKKFHPETLQVTPTLQDAADRGDENAKARIAKIRKNGRKAVLSDVYHGPRVRVHDFTIEGPIYDSWPPASHQVLFGRETDPSHIDVPATIRRFASRAFRRPVKADEVRHYVEFIGKRRKLGDSPERAIKLGLAAILTSPRFLYLDEGNEEQHKTLSPHELASRLSYFIWSSMPDSQLMNQANSKQITKLKSMTRQTERMLSDHRAQAFVDHFTDTWLRLDKLGSMPPDQKAFKQYYNDRLAEAMRQETRLFFKHLLDTNGSIIDLLDSDYTFVNGPLSRLYGIKGVDGEAFQRVRLTKDDRRGGLLGQASVLTLTSNGIETSPVVRGVWVLENILGTPTAPPPPDVEPIEPDTRGSTTIREQLDKHRNVEACANCHRKIDPIGFALEFYDPIGAFRTRYSGNGRNKQPIDGSGQLPSGESFSDLQGLKDVLLNHKDQFTRMLTKKLTTYATGRTMTLRDQAEIDRIATAVAAKGHGLRDLVIAVATSKIFRER
jgi:mono/diheme cytochrome c family protein